MSRPPPASGDQARPKRAPSPPGSRLRRAHVRGRVDFAAINRAALPLLPAILQRVLPRGRRVGNEWHDRNPNRADHHIGSFKVSVRTGRWADFATGDRGGDVVSLIAYLEGCSQPEAARKLAHMLGLDGGGRCHG
jgi:hypothetical protein